ncbi:MAG: glycosyltransferase family 2 protein [Mycobacteriales bacterium]
MTSATVCVAVVVKDRREQLARCLDALAAQDRAPDELLVVDNGSTDGTPELARSRGLRVVEQPGPLGLARQAAVEATTADLLAFTDSDCRPRPGWLAGLLAALTPDVAVVQGRTVPEPGEQRRWASTQQVEGFSHLYECCNLLYRTDVLRAAGGFDTGTGFFGEDTAAGWRVRRLAGPGAFAADAVVEHDLTHPGPAWHLRRALRYAAWPRLVAEFPEMRDELLHRRWFLQPRRVRVALGLGGVATAALSRRPLPLLAALPWAAALRPTRPGRAGIADSAAGLAFDLAVSAGLLAGSVKERRVVL